MADYALKTIVLSSLEKVFPEIEINENKAILC